MISKERNTQRESRLQIHPNSVYPALASRNQNIHASPMASPTKRGVAGRSTPSISRRKGPATPTLSAEGALKKAIESPYTVGDRTEQVDRRHSRLRAGDQPFLHGRQIHFQER